MTVSLFLKVYNNYKERHLVSAIRFSQQELDVITKERNDRTFLSIANRIRCLSRFLCTGTLFHLWASCQSPLIRRIIINVWIISGIDWHEMISFNVWSLYVMIMGNFTDFYCQYSCVYGYGEYILPIFHRSLIFYRHELISFNVSIFVCCYGYGQKHFY